jgi:hypothetical protein
VFLLDSEQDTLANFPCNLANVMTRYPEDVLSGGFDVRHYSAATIFPSPAYRSVLSRVLRTLLRQQRPSIAAMPAVVRYGETFRVDTAQADSIESVALLRPEAATHAFDQNQLRVLAAFSAGEDFLDVAVGSDRDVLPPGDYMLFLIDANGVPSVADQSGRRRAWRGTTAGVYCAITCGSSESWISVRSGRSSWPAHAST